MLSTARVWWDAMQRIALEASIIETIKRPLWPIGQPSEGEGSLCYQNPYKSSLRDPLDVVALRMREWLSPDKLAESYDQAKNDASLAQWNHKRFTFVSNMTSCNNFDCIGGQCRQDTSKIVCGDSSTFASGQGLPESDVGEAAPCIIYRYVGR